MNNFDENNINTNRIIIIVCLVALIVIGFYLFHFAYNDALFWKFIFKLSDDNAKWGTFGDYIGGVLNPIVSAFALYLAAKAYDAQRKDLNLTQDSQEKQVKLAALTALINAKLMQVDGLVNKQMIYETEKSGLLNFRSSTDNTNRIKELEGKIEMLEAKITPLRDKVTELENEVKNIGDL